MIVFIKRLIILRNNFSTIEKLLAKDLIRYVVYHEMCHLLVKNHRKEFKMLIEKIYPDYKSYERKLAEHYLLINNFYITSQNINKKFDKKFKISKIKLCQKIKMKEQAIEINKR